MNDMKKRGKESDNRTARILPEDYVMKEIYDAENLVIGALEYISSEITELGPKVERTNQYYIFELIDAGGEVGYQEVFTGFIAGEKGYFDLPYMVDMEKLTEVLPDYKESNIPKFGMLLVLDKINSKMFKRKYK